MFQGVVKMERKLGGVLADKPKSLLFQDNGSSLSISLEDIGPGWRCKPHTDYQVSVTEVKIQFTKETQWANIANDIVMKHE